MLVSTYRHRGQGPWSPFTCFFGWHQKLTTRFSLCHAPTPLIPRPVSVSAGFHELAQEMTEEAAQPSNEKALRYVQYELEKEHIYLDQIRKLISKDLSEPYSIYVYRYFLNQWGDLCYMVEHVILCIRILELIPFAGT